MKSEYITILRDLSERVMQLEERRFADDEDIQEILALVRAKFRKDGRAYSFSSAVLPLQQIRDGSATGEGETVP